MRTYRLSGLVPAALVVLGIAACQEAPTGPEVLAAKVGTPAPEVYKGVNVHTVYTDDVLCQYAPYNFDVQVDGYDTYTITYYYNLDNSIAKIVFDDKFDGTVTHNSVTLRKQAAGHTVYDFNAGIDTFKGLAAKYSPLGGGRPISVDAGHIAFDINGIIKEAGPHPLFDGPGNDAVCSALQ